MSKIACVSGCTGQVGSYICELLLEQGYKVYGLKRRSSSFNTARIDHLMSNPNLELVYGDITDYSSIVNFVSKAQPDIFINCGAMSHVMVSFSTPIYTMDATGTSVLNCLESIRLYSPHTKFITMSSSEMFGSTPPPQNELTPFHPRSPYAVAKIAGYYSTINYREAYNLFASNIIAFNNESPRRGETFVTRKITMAATRIKMGLQDKLYLGNLSAIRDWSHAKDIADAIYKIVLADKPDDYVAASGQGVSVQEFLERVFNKLNLNINDHVVIDPKYFRAAEVDALYGDASKLKNSLGWSPKYDLNMIIDEMIKSDLKLASNEKILRDLK